MKKLALILAFLLLLAPLSPILAEGTQDVAEAESVATESVAAIAGAQIDPTQSASPGL